MESPRQKKIATLLQQEIAQMLQGSVRKEGVANLLISVTKVSITVDLSIAKIYLSLFPPEKALEVLEGIQSNSFQVKHDLAKLLKNQLRKIPDLVFYLDDSLEYIQKIDEALEANNDPIKNPDELISRKKK
jgi:ribosome-binding factor A